MRILHTSYIGDLLQIDSYLTDYERASIDTIYWATSSEPILRPLVESNPLYSNARHASVKLDPLPWTTLQHNSQKIFATMHIRPFTGSSFITKQQSEDYYIIHPSTPQRDSIQRSLRDLTPIDWKACFQILEKSNTRGIVINSELTDIPKHSSIEDRSGKTTLSEAIDLLSRAGGYIGIDSFTSILASQILPAERLHIKTANPFVANNPWLFYSPHTQFPYLSRHLGGTPYETPSRTHETDHVLVMVTRDVVTKDDRLPRGTSIWISPLGAKMAIAQGDARPVDLKTLEVY